MNNIQFGLRQFAVREHDATTKHWDFRFEHNKTLLSWYSYDPPNLNPYKPTKLFRTNDHQLKYLLSERIIPQDKPGAGPTAIGDMGLYRFLGPLAGSAQLARGYTKIEIYGRRLKGIFSLKLLGLNSETWIWTKEWDDYADLDFQFPPVLTPHKIQELGGKTRAENDFLPFFQGYS